MTLKLKTLALALMMTLPVMVSAMDNQDMEIDSAPSSSNKSREYSIIILDDADTHYQLGLLWHKVSLESSANLDKAVMHMNEARTKGHAKAGDKIKTLGNQNHFARLPLEVITNHIALYLSPNECIKFMMSCKDAYPWGQKPDQTLPADFELFKGCLVFYPSLTELNLEWNETITDMVLAHCSNLASLILCGNETITDAGLASLTSLTSLGLQHNSTITQAGLANVPNLTSLNLEGNETITDTELANFSNLTSLDLSLNKTITDTGLANFSNLTSLNLSSNATITNAVFTNLSNLTLLNLRYNATITDAGLAHCPNLIILNLWDNATITDAGLANCPNLTSLYLEGNESITDDLVSVLKTKGVIVTGR